MSAPRPFHTGQALIVLLAAIWWIWLPLSVLPVLDGVLFVSTGRETARDLGLLWLLGLLPAGACLLAGLLLNRALLAARVGPHRASLAAWAVALAPVLWLGAWQAGRFLLAWARSMSGEGLHVSATVRLGAIVLLAAATLWLVRRWGLAGLTSRVLDALLGLRWAVVLAGSAAVLAVLQLPPRWWGMPWATEPGKPTSGGTAGATADRPDIYLISLDALAAEDAKACDADSPHMPRLAELAAQGICFSRFYSASNFTTATTSTMETGLLPWTHFATQPDAKMLGWTRSHTIGSRLRARGYRTHFLSDNFLANPAHRGTFDSWDTIDFVQTGLFANVLREGLAVFPETALPRLAATALSFFEGFEGWRRSSEGPYSARSSYTTALRRLDLQTVREPVFMWIHSMPPHSPYLPPASTRYSLLPAGELDTWRDLLPDNIPYRPEQQPLVDKHRLRYQESIRAADAALGEFLQELHKRGRLERSVVIVTSDHGESFEQGFLGHAGSLLHDALIHVPLVIKPATPVKVRTTSQVTSQADLAPTILELAGAAALPHAEGRSLVPILANESMIDVPVFSMAMEHQDRFNAIRFGRFVSISLDSRTDLVLSAQIANDVVPEQGPATKAKGAYANTSIEARLPLRDALERANQRRATPPTLGQ